MPKTHRHKPDEPCPAEEQASRACDFLEHYHTTHTHDMITRFHRAAADILIVSDPAWRDRLEKFIAAAFSPEHPTVTMLKELIGKLNEMVEAFETDMTPEKQTNLLNLLRPMLRALSESVPPEGRPKAASPVQ